MTRRFTALVVICFCSWTASVSAQSREPRFEISGGAWFAGGHDLVGSSADLLPNQTGGGAYPVFKAETRQDGAPGFEARLGWRVTPRFIIEGGVFLSRPQLSSRLTADVEGAPDATIVEDLSLYIFDAAVLVPLGGTSDGRLTPFLRVGAGYVRQLHEDNVLVETGQAYHAGGGLTAWFGQGRRAGVRVDARIYLLQGGVDLGTSTRTMAAGGGAFVFAF
jgi:hypothetical protein